MRRLLGQIYIDYMYIYAMTHDTVEENRIDAPKIPKQNCSQSNYRFFKYSNIGLFSIAHNLVCFILLLFHSLCYVSIDVAMVGRAIALWRAIHKRSHEPIKQRNKEIKSDNFCYSKVGSSITKWRAKEKSLILLLKIII